jgi:hypothetical protein
MPKWRLTRHLGVTTPALTGGHGTPLGCGTVPSAPAWRRSQPYREERSVQDAGKPTAQKNGASEGIRTLDIHLGKVTLYRAELRSRP